MFAFKYILHISLLATLALPSTIMADTQIIIDKPYYKNYNQQSRSYSSRANEYLKRHNFGNKYNATVPNLNSYNTIVRGHDSQRRILVRPSYSDRVNIRQRQWDRHSRLDRYRQGYKQGYLHGYNDGITRYGKRSKVGQ